MVVAVPEETRFPFIQAGDAGPNGMAIDALSMVSRQLSVNFDFRVLPTMRGGTRSATDLSTASSQFPMVKKWRNREFFRCGTVALMKTEHR